MDVNVKRSMYVLDYVAQFAKIKIQVQRITTASLRTWDRDEMRNETIAFGFFTLSRVKCDRKHSTLLFLFFFFGFWISSVSFTLLRILLTKILYWHIGSTKMQWKRQIKAEIVLYVTLYSAMMKWKMCIFALFRFFLWTNAMSMSSSSNRFRLYQIRCAICARKNYSCGIVTLWSYFDNKIPEKKMTRKTSAMQGCEIERMTYFGSDVLAFMPQSDALRWGKNPFISNKN